MSVFTSFDLRMAEKEHSKASGIAVGTAFANLFSFVPRCRVIMGRRAMRCRGGFVTLSSLTGGHAGKAIVLGSFTNSSLLLMIKDPKMAKL